MADIYVYGHTVTNEHQAALIARMKAGTSRAADLEAEAIRLGLPERSANRDPVAMRVADRIIQRESKAGNIEFKRPDWVWCGK